MKKNKKVEAKIIETQMFDNEEKLNSENNLIQKKIDEKILLKELAEKRNKEIQKRKYSYFNNDNFTPVEKVDNTKYFFDEGIVDKLSKKNLEKNNREEKFMKKKLQKKKEDLNFQNKQIKLAENKII